MKRTILGLSALAIAASCAVAAPKALYVKKGDKFTKYNYGVAGNLNFSNGGRTLTVSGYHDVIDLDRIDYISFEAPIGSISMTPAQQKERLVQIGQEVNEMVSLYDNSNLVRAIYTFFNSTKVDLGEYLKAPCNFEIDEAIMDSHDEFKKVVKAIGKVASGDPLAARALKAAAAHIYKAEDYFGIYTADYEKELWVKTADSDHLELRFKAPRGGGYIVMLEASEEFCTWETEDFRSRLPQEMTVTVAKDADILATAVISSRLEQDTNIDMEVKVTANGYVVDNRMSVVNDKITDNVNVTVKGNYLLSTNSSIYGKNLLDYTAMKQDIDLIEHDHDENGDCIGEDDPTHFIAHFIRGVAEADVLGKLKVSGNYVNFSKIYDILSEDDENSYGHTVDKDGYVTFGQKVSKIIDGATPIYVVNYEDPELIKRQAECLNTYGDAFFRYSDSDDLQGFMTWEPTEYVDWEETCYADNDYYGYAFIDGLIVNVFTNYDNQWIYNRQKMNEDGSIEWINENTVVDEKDLIKNAIIRYMDTECVPMLTFPDMTSFSMEDFFDEDSFKLLIDDTDDIVDAYEAIVGSIRDNRWDED